MEENFDALEVIAQTKGKVNLDSAPTSNNIFLIWGWPTVRSFIAMFVLWRLLHQEWCFFTWVFIPLVGAPLMIRQTRKDRNRTHIRTHDQKILLDYWIFAGAMCAIGGFALGFSSLSEICFYPLISILIGIGGFITGEVLRFNPMIVCGLAGAAIGLGSFFLQGDIWDWQIPAVALVAFVSLIIPGYLFKKRQ